MGTWQNTSKHHTPIGQAFPSKWPQGCKEQTRKHIKDIQETQITERIHKRNTALEWLVRKLQEGLFDGTNLILISGVDQDTNKFGVHERSLYFPYVKSDETML